MFEDLDEKLQKNPELKKHHQQEKLILDVTELIAKLMEKKNINKRKLASLLNVGSSHVTQLLDGTRNMTLRTIADVFTSLDSELVINTSSLSLGSVQPYQYEVESPVQTMVVELQENSWILENVNDVREKMVA